MYVCMYIHIYICSCFSWASYFMSLGKTNGEEKKCNIIILFAAVFSERSQWQPWLCFGAKKNEVICAWLLNVFQFFIFFGISEMF